MKRAFRITSAFLVLAAVVAGGCRSGASNQQESTQSNFGVRMAKMNLWREALFRFQRAVELNPADALAHNNLAVAYEANGDFEKALREYREAIRLDKSNQFIQKNYSRFVEFTSRNRKRQQRPAPAAATTASAPQASAPATPPPAPAGGEGKSTPPPPGSVASPAPAGTAPASTAPPNPEPKPKPPGDPS